jgi:hypothetical protein
VKNISRQDAKNAPLCPSLPACPLWGLRRYTLAVSGSGLEQGLGQLHLGRKVQEPVDTLAGLGVGKLFDQAVPADKAIANGLDILRGVGLGNLGVRLRSMRLRATIFSYLTGSRYFIIFFLINIIIIN